MTYEFICIVKLIENFFLNTYIMLFLDVFIHLYLSIHLTHNQVYTTVFKGSATLPLAGDVVWPIYCKKFNLTG